MQYGVLGPLEVSGGEQSIEIAGSKQRALLAMLLLHANEVVSTDRLIDALWGEAPPERAGNGLHPVSVVDDRRGAYGGAVGGLEAQRQADEEEALVDDVLEVVEVLVVREAALAAGPVRRILVGEVDEIGRDRLDAEDLHAAIRHPVHGLGRDAAEAVEERGRAGRAVVVVGAEQQDVALAQLLPEAATAFSTSAVVTSCARGYSRMSTQTASPQKRSSGISPIVSPPRR